MADADGVLSIGSVTASLTLPTEVLQSHPPTVYLEIRGDGVSELRQELFMEFSGGKVPLANGAVLQLAHGAGERLQFTLITREGQLLCSWQPSFRRGWREGAPPDGPEAFSHVEAWHFRKTGDPIVLLAGADESREFAIDGRPAMVLSRTPWEVILRDPQPMAGRRTIESKGYAIELRFIDVEMSFSKPSSDGRATLTIQAPKLDLWGRRLRPRRPPLLRASEYTLPTMWLHNFSRDTVNVLCGKTYWPNPRGTDDDEVRQIRVTEDKIRNGVFLVTCPVRFRKRGLANIDVVLFEAPPFKRAPLFNHPFGLPFPR
jgi:hypothetical protein